MSQILISVGTNPNDGSGELLRTAMSDINSMFTEQYALNSSTINAAAVDYNFSGATYVQRINLAVADGIVRVADAVYIPAFMLPFDVTAVTNLAAFHAIGGKLVREGGDQTVFDWRAYGADVLGVTDVRPSAQASLDGAELAGGDSYAPPGTYVTGPSNGALPPVAGDYSIQIGTGARLVMAPGALLIRRYAGGGVVNATIRNKNITTGNTDIALIGGEIKTTNALNTGKHVGFTRVTRFRWFDTKLRGVVGDWNSSLNVTDATIRGIVMDSSASITNDGLHIVGGQRITVDGCSISCGDDCISVWPDQDGNQDNISDVTIRGIVCSTAGSNCIRVGVPAAAAELVRRIVISGVVGQAGSAATGTGITVADTTASSKVREIDINHVILDCATNGGSPCNIDDVDRLTLSHVQFITPASRIEIDGGSDITLDCVRVQAPRGAGVQALLVASSKAVSRLKIIGGDYNTATSHGIELGTAGFAVTDYEIIGATVRGCTNDGIRIRNASGGRVIGNRCRDNGSFGIEEIAPSDNNIITDNDVRTNSGGAVILAGASTEMGRNIGADGTMQGRTSNGMITLTDAATIATDASKGNAFKVTVTAARAFGAPTNPLRGQRCSWTVVQDGTGGWAVTFNAVFKFSWSDTGNTLNKRSTIAGVYDGTNWNQDGAQSPYV